MSAEAATPRAVGKLASTLLSAVPRGRWWLLASVLLAAATGVASLIFVRRPVAGGSGVLRQPSKASRIPSRFLRMVIQARPAWKPSRTSFSQRARESYSGTPHSSS